MSAEKLQALRVYGAGLQNSLESGEAEKKKKLPILLPATLQDVFTSHDPAAFVITNKINS